ncbi:hypothetical protein Pyn_29903 [Prunus yedoensis var. nudiflora]|uniref:Uncharacterized protein n=1 Tax=Prunus yedoensis var. nudiflora TaxID=2094558 RepID=A0A314UX24_PRUYE|nr:hypothetical protein Pyn_29903 [Prunus yedoensis var. nudiflora]
MVVDVGSDTEVGLNLGLREHFVVADSEGEGGGREGLGVAEALMAISTAIFATLSQCQWQELSVLTVFWFMDQKDFL